MEGFGYDGWSRGSGALEDFDDGEDNNNNNDTGGGDSGSSASFSAYGRAPHHRSNSSTNQNRRTGYDDHSSASSKDRKPSSSYGWSKGAGGSSAAANSRGGKSDYDYDISLDDLDDVDASLGAVGSSIPMPARSSSSQEPRLSQAERTQRLIQRASSERRSTLSRERTAKKEDDDAVAFSSFQESWNDLMQGLESHSASASLSRSRSVSPNPLRGGGNDQHQQQGQEGDSPMRGFSGTHAVPRSPNESDSFEISAGDFEVGALAARRSKEKAQERRRGRRSFDFDQLPTKIAMSPEPAMVSGKTGVPKSGALASESYALSSIDHAEDAAVRMAGSVDTKVYGGVDKSDGELFAKLTASRGKDSVPQSKDSGSRSRGSAAHEDDDYDYSSDDFEPSIQTEPKRNTTNAVVSGVSAPTSDVAASNLRISEAELERRKSLELIQQRWFSAQSSEPLKAPVSALETSDRGIEKSVEGIIEVEQPAVAGDDSKDDDIGVGRSDADASAIVNATEVSDPPSPPSSAAASTEGNLITKSGDGASEVSSWVESIRNDSSTKDLPPKVRVSFDLGKNIQYDIPGIVDFEESVPVHEAEGRNASVGVITETPLSSNSNECGSDQASAVPVTPDVPATSSYNVSVEIKPNAANKDRDLRMGVPPITLHNTNDGDHPLPATTAFVDLKTAPTIDMVVPSIDDLHAQLAAIKAAEERRKENKNKATKKAGYEVPIHDRKRRSVSPPPPPLPSSAPEWDSLSRLEQSNARLNRQFDELNDEIRHLRGTTGSKSATKLAKDTKKLNHSGNGYVSDGKSTRVNVGTTVHPAQYAETQIPKTPSSRPLFQDWDNDALASAKDIVRINADMKEKEHEIAERERIIEIKENLINQTFSARQKQLNSIVSNDTEIADLKSQLFQANQQIFQLHAAAKRALGEPDDQSMSEKEKNWDSTHYFQLTAAYLNRIGGSHKSKFPPSLPVTKISSSDHILDEGGGCWVNGEYFIPNSIFLALQKEKAGLESLLEASQKENERLMSLIKSHEKETKQKDAIYFDQQSELVMEINRLKNQLEKFAGIPIASDVGINNGCNGNVGMSTMVAPAHMSVTSSAANTRAMLQSEAAVWRLTEKLAESEARASEREHKLQQTIGKLKLELENATSASHIKTYQPESFTRIDHRRFTFASKLVGAAASLGAAERTSYIDDDLPPPPPRGQPPIDADISCNEISPEDLEISRLRLALEEQKAIYEKELDDMRSRLLWYAENQKRIDALEREVDSRHGKASKLNISHSSASKPLPMKRDPRDARRIRELEQTCADLSEALKKRFPDSTASLLYAASSAGIGANPAELDALKRENAALKDEIEANRAEFDIKLRALRQDCERMRIEYEVKLKKSTSETSGTTRSSTVKAHESNDHASGTTGIRNMNQALQKIKELEQNEGRLRSFYVRKIEQLSKRSESQLQAVKRGTSSSAPAAGPDLPDRRSMANEVEKDFQIMAEQLESENQKLRDEKKELLSRTQMLEDELMRTAEELGNLRKASDSRIVSSEKSPDSPILSNVVEQQKREIEELKQAISALSDLKEKHPLRGPVSAASNDAHIQQALSDRDVRIRELEERVLDYRSQLDRISKRDDHSSASYLSQLGAMQDRISSLIEENAILQMTVKEMKSSPMLVQLNALEKHIFQLEEKLTARAEDLRRATEDGKSAIQMERIRLQSIHEQEMREKDGQIVLFQKQLEDILDSLRQQ